MNKRNVCFVLFNDQEYSSINIPDIRDSKSFWNKEDKIHHRFPYVYRFKLLEDAVQHQGFILFINNNSNINLITFDKKYRNLLHYDYIAMVNSNYKNGYKFDKFSRIGKINSRLLYGEYSYIFLDDFYLSINDHKKKNHKCKDYYKDLINILKEKKSISTSELLKLVHINKRTLERDMNIINEFYNCVGYDYSLNKWYYV